MRIGAGAGRACGDDLERESYVAEDVEPWEEHGVLEHHAKEAVVPGCGRSLSVDADLAARGDVEVRDEPEQR
jgi:hypothetical protein